MSDQLQDLLKRVYDEGVSKANAEAEVIINNANKKAEEIVNLAKIEAETKLKQAEKDAADIKKNTSSDLQMAVNHSLSAVKQKVTELILSQTLNAKLSTTFAEAEFLKKLIMEALEAWKTGAAGGTIVISEAMKPHLDEFFLQSVTKLFDGKLVVDFSPIMKQGFQISPEDGTYKLSFSDEDFANLFKTYLRPRTKELLFGN